MRAHVFSFAAMVSFAAVSAAAANPCVVLELSAPAECPSATVVEQTVMELVHTVPPAPLAARATIVKQGERYAVTVVTAAGERTFDGETCQGAADALSVILALAVDPNASTTPAGTPPPIAAAPTPAPAPAAQPAPQPANPPPAQPPPAAPVTPGPEQKTEPSRTSRGPEPLKFGGSLFFILDSGFLPTFGVGAAGGFRLASGLVSAEAGARFLLPNSTSFESDPNVGGTFSWAAGALDGCLQLLAPLHGCVGFEIGGLTGEGFGIDTPFTRTATIADLTTGFVGRAEVGGGIAVEGRLGVAVLMARPVFGLEGFGELHRPDAVSLRAGFGIAL